MKILVINCGSSSIKYQLLDMRSESDYSLLAKGNLEKISLPDSKITHKPVGKEPMVKVSPVADHTEGMKVVLAALTDPVSGVISSFEEIDAVGHRIVQGADFFSGPALIDEDVMEKITICCDYAPLHNPAHILGIRAMQEVLPQVPQVAVFDTAFHQTMAPEVYMYALPYEYYEKYRVRRYGAHGTSHKYVSQRAIRFAGLDPENSRIITCHIGNGSSVNAVRNGKCFDTSMVNKKSGFLGLSGKTSDMRDVLGFAAEGDARSQLVVDKLILDITKLIGQYIAEMGGVDLIVFTAGIAENNPWLPVNICSHFGYMGLKMAWEMENKSGVDFYKECQASVKAHAVSDEAYISAPDSAIKVAMIPTNEELMIAIDTMNLTK